MQIDLMTILQAARQTLRAPRAVARSLIDQQFPASFGWMAIALAVIIQVYRQFKGIDVDQFSSRN